MEYCYVKLYLQGVKSLELRFSPEKKMNGNINCFSNLIVAASKGGFIQIKKKKGRNTMNCFYSVGTHMSACSGPEQMADSRSRVPGSPARGSGSADAVLA